MNRNQALEYARIINALIEVTDVSIILNNFVKAFKTKTIIKRDKYSYLHGHFKLGGTVSGRLSCSDPNLMNIPSTGSQYAKKIKECFIAPTGWIMVGADFSSLEDKISALTTKDPNKIKVYTDGYDGHCLRAFKYFGTQMPDIINTVDSINSIEVKYPKLRQKSKEPTFLLTYQGTYHGLMKNVGLSEEEALDVEYNYHDLYKVSDAWIQNKIKQACSDGYTDVAFGLRLRTPVLGQCIYNLNYLPYEAVAEGRTMGNAHGQSYGMLNNRAAIELQERLLASQHVYNILPMSHIHDAQYFIIRDEVAVLEWLNNNLIECMEWQKLPEIQHSDVKLGGQLSVFYPNWAYETKVPNRATQKELMELFKGGK